MSISVTASAVEAEVDGGVSPSPVNVNPSNAEQEHSGQDLEVEILHQDAPDMRSGLVAGPEEHAVAEVAASSTTSNVPGQIALDIINAERAKAKLPPILNVQPMYDAALAWSTYMDKHDAFLHMYEVHDSRYQNSFAKNAGWQLGGDLIGKGYLYEESVAKAWLNSPAHRAWLMDAHGKMGAAGVAQVGKYWTLYIAGNPGSGKVDQTPTGQEPEPPLEVTLDLTISGELKSGATVTMAGGVRGVDAAGLTMSYSWKRGDGKTVSGQTLKLTNADAGRAVHATFMVTDPKTQRTSSRTVKVNIAEIPVERMSGPCRYTTCAAVNDASASSKHPVFVATGQSFPDALSIGPAVAKTGGSLFLSGTNSISPEVLNAIKAKKPSEVFIVGGQGAVSQAVAATLQASTGVTPQRIGGANRYETSAKIYKRFFQGQSVPVAFVATGRDYPDALTAAAAGGALGAPVLLVDGKGSRGLDDDILRSLKSATRTVAVVGGVGAVNGGIQTKLGREFKAERLAGPGRYETNVAVNNYLTTKTGTAPTEIWIATGKNFPDALSAAAPAGTDKARLILSNGSCIPNPVVSSWIRDSSSKVENVNLVGGSGALSRTVETLTECK